VHRDRYTILGKYLLQEHPGDFTGLDVGVRHEMSVRSITASPTEAQAFFLCRSRLNEDVS